MPDNLYYVEEQKFNLPDEELEGFLQTFPEAVKAQRFVAEQDTFDIPENEVEEFIKTFPDAKPEGVTEGLPKEIVEEKEGVTKEEGFAQKALGFLKDKFTFSPEQEEKFGELVESAGLKPLDKEFQEAVEETPETDPFRETLKEVGKRLKDVNVQTFGEIQKALPVQSPQVLKQESNDKFIEAFEPLLETLDPKAEESLGKRIGKEVALFAILPPIITGSLLDDPKETLKGIGNFFLTTFNNWMEAVRQPTDLLFDPVKTAEARDEIIRSPLFHTLPLIGIGGAFKAKISKLSPKKARKLSNELAKDVVKEVQKNPELSKQVELFSEEAKITPKAKEVPVEAKLAPEKVTVVETFKTRKAEYKEFSDGKITKTTQEGTVEISKEAFDKALEQKTPKKVSKIAESIESKAIEADLTKEFKDLAEFTPTTIKKQAVLMADVMQNVETATNIIKGTEPLPKGLNPSTVISTMEKFALENQDGILMSELAKSPLVSETSVAAQTLRLTQERTPESPVRAIKDLEKVRQESLDRKLKVTSQEKVQKNLRSSLDKKIKTTKPSKFSWEQLINDIICR